MGKSKPSGAPPPPSEAVPAHAEAGVCAICYEVIEKNEEFMEVECSRCGRWNVHMDCGTGYLEEYIKRDNSNSVCVQKYKTLVTKRPKYFFSSEGVRCPRKAGASGKQLVPGSRKSKDKANVVACSCPGTCIDADIIKPAKQAPAPAPQPARPAKQPAAPKREQRQKKEQLPALAGVRRKKGRPPALPTTPAHKAGTAAASINDSRATLSATLSTWQASQPLLLASWRPGRRGPRRGRPEGHGRAARQASPGHQSSHSAMTRGIAGCSTAVARTLRLSCGNASRSGTLGRRLKRRKGVRTSNSRKLLRRTGPAW
ncbi:hypothetical protein ABPG77_007376 [Micractinium sp. CCAP 211/92]